MRNGNAPYASTIFSPDAFWNSVWEISAEQTTQSRASASTKCTGRSRGSCQRPVAARSRTSTIVAAMSRRSGARMPGTPSCCQLPAKGVRKTPMVRSTAGSIVSAMYTAAGSASAINGARGDAGCASRR